MNYRCNNLIRFFSGSVHGLAATLLLSGVLQSPAIAATRLQCSAISTAGVTLLNQANSTYSDEDGTVSNSTSASVSGQVTRGGALSIASGGLYDASGTLIYSLGTIAAALDARFVTQGWSQDEARQASVAAVKAFARLSPEATMQETIAAIKTALVQTLPARATEISSGSWDAPLAVAFVGLDATALQAIGLTSSEAQTIGTAAIAVVSTTAGTVNFSQMAQTAVQDAMRAVPHRAPLLTIAMQTLATDIGNLRTGKASGLGSGSTLRFKFTLTNTGSAPIDITPPTVNDIQQTGMVGTATVTGTMLEGANPAVPVTLVAGQQMNLWVDATIGTVPQGGSPLAIGFSGDCGGAIAQQTITLLPPITALRLTSESFGQITGCDGEILSDYRGIRVALYRPEANDNTGEVRDLLRLTATEFPDNPANNTPAGIEPNRQNSNPFGLGDRGRYHFLLSRAQLRSGQTYILVISPPPDSDYSERRIRIAIGDATSQGFAFRATTLDGQPLNAPDRQTSVNGILSPIDSTRFLLGLDTSICQSEPIEIVKSGDRAAAAPGDTVIYRLLVRNLSTTNLDRLTVTDTLPLGFDFIADSVRAEVGDRTVSLEVERQGATVSFRLNGSLPEDETLSIAYGAQLTPDALRGNGQNSAIARGRRNDNQWTVRDGPAIHRLRVESGIITDCGTILGRVFVDQNFDGEQQPGEPGIPNAVIYLDDGNRITTDANGLFSVANVLPGYRTGALDLTSIPDYTLAPNRRFIERNSPARLVQLAPGGMVRMNFGVTPISPEAER